MILFCQETLKKLNGTEPEKDTINRKRKKPKGPNPLSCKKKKTEEGAKKKKKKNKKTGNAEKNELAGESHQNAVLTDTSPSVAVE